jgi:hypothetical protein
VCFEKFTPLDSRNVQWPIREIVPRIAFENGCELMMIVGLLNPI